jgi:hypothetical protein
MNERIRELAKQAGIKFIVPTGFITAIGSQAQEKHLEKFAQLIAQDCAELLDTSRQNTPPDHWGFVARIWTLQEAAKIIRNYFGVSK